MGKFEKPRRSLQQEFDVQTEDIADILAEDGSELVADEPQTMSWDKKRKIILISVCAGVLTLLIGLIVGIIVLSGGPADDGLILDNVFAGGVDLGGMTTEEAAAALHLATDRSFSRRDMTVQITEDLVLTLSPKDTGASLDVDAVVKAAYDYGRTGSEEDYLRAKKNAERNSYTVPLLPYLTIDLEYIRQTVDEFCTDVQSELSEPVVELQGDRPTYDPEKPDAPIRHQKLHITLGTPEFQLDADDLYDRILDAYSMNELEPQYEAPEMILPTAIDVAALFQKHCIPAKDAVMNPDTYEITPEEFGYGFDEEELQQKLDSAEFGDVIQINLSFFFPKVLASELSENLFLDTLGEYRSASDVINTDRNTNLKLSCEAINNYVVKAGETFSFNKVIGELSQQAGYLQAPISTFNDSVTGGGISQTASALYYCALLANLDIIERHSHVYCVDFTEFGLDALVDGKDKDLRFRNNSNSPIRIIAQADGNTVYVELQGTNSLGYTIKINSQVVNKYDPAVSYHDMAADNPTGYRNGDILQKGIPGYEIAVYMEKRDSRSGELLSSLQVSTSKYEKIDEIRVQIPVVIPDPSITESTEQTQPLFNDWTFP